MEDTLDSEEVDGFLAHLRKQKALKFFVDKDVLAKIYEQEPVLMENKLLHKLALESYEEEIKNKKLKVTKGIDDTYSQYSPHSSPAKDPDANSREERNPKLTMAKQNHFIENHTEIEGEEEEDEEKEGNENTQDISESLQLPEKGGRPDFDTVMAKDMYQNGVDLCQGVFPRNVRKVTVPDCDTPAFLVEFCFTPTGVLVERGPDRECQTTYELYVTYDQLRRIQFIRHENGLFDDFVETTMASDVFEAFFKKYPDELYIRSIVGDLSYYIVRTHIQKMNDKKCPPVMDSLTFLHHDMEIEGVPINEGFPMVMKTVTTSTIEGSKPLFLIAHEYDENYCSVPPGSVNGDPSKTKKFYIWWHQMAKIVVRHVAHNHLQDTLLIRLGDAVDHFKFFGEQYVTEQMIRSHMEGGAWRLQTHFVRQLNETLCSSKQPQHVLINNNPNNRLTLVMDVNIDTKPMFAINSYGKDSEGKELPVEWDVVMAAKKNNPHAYTLEYKPWAAIANTTIRVRHFNHPEVLVNSGFGAYLDHIPTTLDYPHVMQWARCAKGRRQESLAKVFNEQRKNYTVTPVSASQGKTKSYQNSSVYTSPRRKGPAKIIGGSIDDVKTMKGLRIEGGNDANTQGETLARPLLEERTGTRGEEDDNLKTNKQTGVNSGKIGEEEEDTLETEDDAYDPSKTDAENEVMHGQEEDNPEYDGNNEQNLDETADGMEIEDEEIEDDDDDTEDDDYDPSKSEAPAGKSFMVDFEEMDLLDNFIH